LHHAEADSVAKTTVSATVGEVPATVPIRIKKYVSEAVLKATSDYKERQREGLALAKKRGAYQGRKRTLTTVQAVVLLQRIAAGESKTKLAKELGVSRNTVYMYMGRGGN